MPRYNLNQDDVQMITDALSHKADQAWDPKEQSRVRRLIMRLQGKVDALSKNVNTQQIEKQEQIQIEQPHFHDDPVWNFYSKKD
jgi:hypothetical protein